MSSVIGYLLSVVSTVHAIEIDAGFAGPSGGTGENIADYIKNIYIYGVSIAGILAVGVIVFGAIYYAASGGNPDKQRDARGYITSALWGLALLLGSYLILNTINPRITTLSALQNLGVCRAGESSRESGCIPPAPLGPCTGKPTDQPGTNCLPFCGAGQTPCNAGETPENNNCVRCFPKAPECPQAVYTRCEPNQRVADHTGDNFGIFPGCTGRVLGIPGSGNDCSEGFRSQSYQILENAKYWVAPYYPEKDINKADCVIYAYEDVTDRICLRGACTEGASTTRKASVVGLKLCPPPL